MATKKNAVKARATARKARPVKQAKAKTRAKQAKAKPAKQAVAKSKPRIGNVRPQPVVPDASYRVRGFVVHLGDDLPPAKRRAALQTLAEQVPQFAHVIDGRALARAKPLGKGAADVLIPLPRRKPVDVRDAWNIVHALRRHRLVADAEPAVRTISGSAGPEELHAVSAGAGPQARGALSSLFGDDDPLPQASDHEWSCNNARISGLWPQTRGHTVLVGHPDTGYTPHPQLDMTRLLTSFGYNFEEGRSDPLDPMTGLFPGHGTGTASVIMSNDNPDPGVFGAAPDVRVIPYRVSDSVIHFDFTNLTLALYRARDQGCHLISMSLGGPWAGRSLSRAVDDLVGRDIILLAAAGNVYPFVVYPAKLDNVVACAASNAIDETWDKSAHGGEVDITAPGESVWRALSQIKNGALDTDVKPSSGTSYAVATTAGACALWLDKHGPDNLRTLYKGRLAAVFMNLLKTVGFRSVPGWDTGDYGPGILDATALLNAPLPAQAPALVSRIPQAVATSQRSYAWARLQPYFPELGPDELARAVVPAFGKKSAAAARRLADVIDEVEFFAATNPAVRQGIIAAARPPRSVRAARAMLAPAGVKDVLRAVGSQQLRSKLG